MGLVQFSLPLDNIFEIQLTKGFSTVVDFEDRDLADFKWSARLSGNTAYACRHSPWNNGKRHEIAMHRKIMEEILGRQLQSREEVDHVNGNGLDNRRSNLRLATRLQNSQNIGKKRNSKNPYKGIYYYKKIGRWRARIKFNGKRIFLGSFYTPEEAYAAYCRAALELFGDFARLK